MAGNVWEWVQAGQDRTGSGQPEGLLKGGSAASVFLLPRAANRLVLPRTYRDGDIGFRCAAADRAKSAQPPGRR